MQSITRTILKFSDLALANIRRLPVFKNAKGEPAHKHPEGRDWTLLEWFGAIAGEVGEGANLAKKVRRGDLALDDVIDVKGVQMTVRQALGHEIADIVCYSDIAATQLGLDLGALVCDKFNEISERVGSTVKL